MTSRNFETKTDLTPVEAFAMIIKAEFRPFSRFDWRAFAGCKSEKPYIAYYDGYVLVWDNDVVEIVHMNDDHCGQVFILSDANA